MKTILPIQSRFDKGIPDISGNAEYHMQEQLLITIDEIITRCCLESPVVEYFLDIARVNKYISTFGTGKSSRLSAVEHDNAREIAVLALRMSILRKHLCLSLRKFSCALCHSDLYRWFCGINRFATPSVPGKSRVAELENSIPSKLIKEVERAFFCAVQSETSQLLAEPLDFSKCYFDSTCISANIHHPIDWILLRDASRTLMKATARIRKLGLCNRMPVEPHVFISRMNNLCMEMTFTKRKKGSKKLRKNVFRNMKKLMKRINDHAMSHLRLLEDKWQGSGISQSQAEQIIRQISNVTDKLNTAVKNAYERIIGERQVKNEDKILSLYEDDVNVIVRKKAGSEVEFGNTLYLAEQSDGLIIDWKFFAQQAPSDSKMLKASHRRIENNLGVEVKLMAGDRGFDSRKNQEYMQTNDIFNAVCPRSPALMIQRLEEDEFRQAQKRRSQTEARISILSHCFCGSPMKQKGFKHRETHMALSILSHNLWVLARLKIKQELQQQQAA